MANSVRSKLLDGKQTRPAGDLDRWKLEDAKARFSEVVRLAGAAGPQLVTVRGREAAVILAADEYDRLVPKAKVQKPLLGFLQSLGLDEIDLDREREMGREIDL